MQLPTSPADPLNSCAAVGCASMLAGGVMESLTAMTSQTRRTAVSSCFFPPRSHVEDVFRILLYDLFDEKVDDINSRDLRGAE